MNEKIYDLLADRNSARKGAPRAALALARDADGRTVVDGAAECEIADDSQIRALVQTVGGARRRAETALNANSSRSHVVYRIVVRGATLSIVDLAGAERTKTVDDARLRESCNINRSMMVLGRCIRSLALRQAAVPYRESLITRIFKDFFKSPGKCAVAAVIVTITPSAEQFDDTSFSLAFAVDAAKCCTAGGGDENEEPAAAVVDPVFQRELALQTQRYLDNLDRCYRAQFDDIMRESRWAYLSPSRTTEGPLRCEWSPEACNRAPAEDVDGITRDRDVQNKPN
jgi:hypothetical protein